MVQRTTLIIETQEAVTPAYLAMRVAGACARYGALRAGERVGAADVTPTPWFTITDEPVDLPDLFV